MTEEQYQRLMMAKEALVSTLKQISDEHKLEGREGLALAAFITGAFLATQEGDPEKLMLLIKANIDAGYFTALNEMARVPN